MKEGFFIASVFLIESSKEIMDRVYKAFSAKIASVQYFLLS